MQSSEQTKSWPIYSQRADAPGLRDIDQWTGAIDAAIAAHPDLVAKGSVPGVEDTSTASKVAAFVTAGLVGELEQEYIVTRFQARPSMNPGDAGAAVREIMGAAIPGGLSYATLVTEAFGGQVIAQSALDLRAGAIDVADKAASALPWLTVGLVAVAVIFVARTAR